ncbi:hypothetical protein BJX63DRAFT_382139 [Aspergillus granulosus]|uniref:Uncharacterized protein n=1 Tax=Aspergillus granulosus TaxID=176169 RepID=A0ABR4HVE6_9EURO
MAPAPNQVLKAYNEALDLRQAYTWDRQRISEFLRHVVDYGYVSRSTGFCATKDI